MDFKRSALATLFLASFVASWINDPIDLSLAFTGVRDTFGRNFFLLILKGLYSSLLIVFTTLLISFSLGTVFGLALQRSSGVTRWLGDRLLDFFLSFPGFLIALYLAWIFRPSYFTLCFSLVLGNLPYLTRLVDLRAKEIAQEQFVRTSYALGASHFHVYWNHLVPGVLQTLSVKIPSVIASILLAETSLTFLGIGVPSGGQSLGHLIHQGKDYLLEAPQLLIFSGATLFFVVNLLKSPMKTSGRVIQF